MCKNICYKSGKFIVFMFTIGASIFIQDASKIIVKCLKNMGLNIYINEMCITVILFFICLLIVTFLDNKIDRVKQYGEFENFVNDLTETAEGIKEVNSNYANQLGKIEKSIDDLYIEKLSSIKEYTSQFQEDTAKTLSEFIERCFKKELVKKNKLEEFNHEITHLEKIVKDLTRLDSIVEKKIKVSVKKDNENKKIV